ncbi:MAG: tetratricopeptide repeat protein [Magnetococcales bacterium]|nr:tetratricopeptide repeat protein [Magnetococcales bacterium]
MTGLRWIAVLLIVPFCGGEALAGYSAPPAPGRVPDPAGRSDPSVPALSPGAVPRGVRPAVGAPTLRPFEVQEEDLSGTEVVGETLPLKPESVERLLEDGAVHLALELADQALGRGGAPLSALRWLAVKTAAHLRLGEFSQVRILLDGMPEEQLLQSPQLLLTRAGAAMAEGRYGEARDQYSRFMISHPDHPGRFRAQRGLGLCALGQGNEGEAELQLNLYAEEAGRPQPDSLLDGALATLAQRKGWYDQVEKLLQGIRHPLEPVSWQERVERLELRRLLAELLAERGDFPGALEQAREMLVEGGGQRGRVLHTGLFRRWLAERVPGTGASASSVSDESRREATCSGSQRIAWDRRNRLALLSDPNAEELEQEAALETLLAWELEEKLGLLEPEGLLTPEALNLPAALPEPFRLLYADAFFRLGNGEMADRMLGTAMGLEADTLRLGLLAMGHGVEPLPTVTARLAARAGEKALWSPRMKQRMVTALFRFKERGQGEEINGMRELLALFAWDKAVERALRFHQARTLRRQGELDAALMIFLSLAYEKGAGEEDRYLPASPRRMAAEILDEQGALESAAVLRGTDGKPF